MWAELRELRDDLDFGTPPRQGAPVTLTIDDQPVTVPAGSSVMLAAAMAGRSIPKLCATDTLEPFGSCRVCLVEIDGRKGYPASCTTLVEPGMAVRTETEKLQSLRRGVLELYLSDFPAGDIPDGWSEFPATLTTTTYECSQAGQLIYSAIIDTSLLQRAINQMERCTDMVRVLTAEMEAKRAE